MGVCRTELSPNIVSVSWLFPKTESSERLWCNLSRVDLGWGYFEARKSKTHGCKISHQFRQKTYLDFTKQSWHDGHGREYVWAEVVVQKGVLQLLLLKLIEDPNRRLFMKTITKKVKIFKSNINFLQSLKRTSLKGFSYFFKQMELNLNI